MPGMFEKINDLTITLTDLILEEILSRTNFKEFIDKRIDEKVAIQIAALNLPKPEIEKGFLRVSDIVRTKDNPNPLLPISRASFLAKVKTGEYPAAVKIGPRTTAWRKEDITKLIKHFESKKK